MFPVCLYLVINFKHRMIVKLLVNHLKHCNEEECISSSVVFVGCKKIAQLLNWLRVLSSISVWLQFLGVGKLSIRFVAK